MILNKAKVLAVLNSLLEKDDLRTIKSKISGILSNIESFRNDRIGILNIDNNGDTVRIRNTYFVNELNQIIETRTMERAKYYVERLIKSLSETRTSKINDINLYRWKEYNDILTDSLWLFDKRDNSGIHSSKYWGNFVPQIPNQLIRRYTKAGEWILDPFLGCGTTLIECQRLGRNGIGVELQPRVCKIAKENISRETNLFMKNVITEVISGDSAHVDFAKILKRLSIRNVHFAIMHPPYWDIIKFSDDRRDLSNAESRKEFLELFGNVLDNTLEILESNRFFAIVIGDKYSKGEWIPLGFYTMQEVLKRGHKLKSIIVKNFEETTGKRNQKQLWRYRALVGGFYIFKHEYILLFKRSR